MKKIFILVSLLLSTNSNAYELHNFNEVKTAIITGKTIHISVDFSKCSLPPSASPSIGIFTPNAIHVTDDHIATSLTHFTLDNPSFLGKPVYEFVRYTITKDDNVNLTDQVLDATNYRPVSEKFSFNCKIDAGAKIFD